VEENAEAGRKSFREYICDTAELLNRGLTKEIRPIRSAQGTMLDIDHGTISLCDSSSATSGGGGDGVGVPPTKSSTYWEFCESVYDESRRRAVSRRKCLISDAQEVRERGERVWSRDRAAAAVRVAGFASVALREDD